MKKLIGLLGSFGLVAAAGITVVSCGDKDKDNNDVKDLSKVINQKDLTVDVTTFDGKIGSRDFYTSTENNVSIIVAAINTANEGINIDAKDIEVHGITSKGAKISPIKDSTKYSGQANIFFKEASKNIKTADVKDKTKDIKNLAGLTEVNDKLKEIANTMEGLKSANAVVKENSKTDVTVTIAAAGGYKIVGDDHFDIAGAIAAAKL